MKVIKSDENILVFDNGLEVSSEYEQECCERNYLDFEQLPVGTEMPDMDDEEFKKSVSLKEDGFSVMASDGFSKWVQARSLQNGYYSRSVTPTVTYNDKTTQMQELDGEVSE